MGLPEFSDASLPACHGLWTPADLHPLALAGISGVAFGVRYNPRRPQQTYLEAVPALQGARRPYGLQDSLSTLRPPCSPPFGDSATHARLDTGGWLALTRRGLSPRKKRRAYLGARTARVQPSAGSVFVTGPNLQ